MGTLNGVARRLRASAKAAGLLGRTFLGVNSNPVPHEWRHITKVDPEERKRLPLLYPLYLSHTSAVSVGGSSDVTEQNTEETFRLLRWAPVPVFHEPSDATHVTDYTREQCYFLAIPEVLNGDSGSLVGTLGKGIEHVQQTLAPSLLDEKLPGWMGTAVRDRLAEFATYWLLERAVFEAYIIQNPDSAAAREANVSPDDLLDPDGARQRALAAERHLGSEVVYVEYSGTFGDDEGTAILESVSDAVSWPQVWYGGGISDRRSANRMLEAGADAVVVGDVFHDVATEERDLCARAEASLPSDADVDDVLEWVDGTVPVADSAAAQYLSTIPSVDSPVERARQYVAATVHTSVQVHALARTFERRVTPDGVRRHAAEEGVSIPGRPYLEPVLDDDGTAFSARLVADLIGTDRRLPVHHLGVDAVDERSHGDQ